jgi:hypothetical protein
MVYVTQLQSRQLEQQSKTQSAAKVAKLYQLTTEVMFEPLVELVGSNDDLESWKVNETIKALKHGNSAGTYIYLNAESALPQEVADFFNGFGFNAIDSSCDAVNGVKHKRVDCTVGLDEEFRLNGYSIKGIQIDGEERSFFSINHTGNADVSNIKPSAITIFIDGLRDKNALGGLYELGEAVSQQVSQIDDMENSAYAQLYVADFGRQEGDYQTNEKLEGALIEPGAIGPDAGIAIRFELDGTQALRSDGMVAMQQDRSLCWNVFGGTEEYICQSAIASGHASNGEESRFIKTDGNLLYQTSAQNTGKKTNRTPVEVVVRSFDDNCTDGSQCDPIQISKPVCPSVDGDSLVPHLSVVSSSFSNSGYGRYPDPSESTYGQNENSRSGNEAEITSGVLFRWEETSSQDAWDVSGIVGSPNDQSGTEGKNPQSLQIVALRWCEKEE